MAGWTVHGVDDLQSSHSATRKIIWCTILLLAFSAMSVGLHKIVKAYISKLYMATADHLTITAYPDFIYCPFSASDPKALQKNNLSVVYYRFLETFFTRSRTSLELSKDSALMKKLQSPNLMFEIKTAMQMINI